MSYSQGKIPDPPLYPDLCQVAHTPLIHQVSRTLIIDFLHNPEKEQWKHNLFVGGIRAVNRLKKINSLISHFEIH